jgi:hypothetical protein
MTFVPHPRRPLANRLGGQRVVVPVLLDVLTLSLAFLLPWALHTASWLLEVGRVEFQRLARSG